MVFADGWCWATVREVTTSSVMSGLSVQRDKYNRFFGRPRKQHVQKFMPATPDGEIKVEYVNL